MKNFNNLPKRFMLTSLASSLMLWNISAYALQEMSEQDLRKIDGQDGVSVTTQYDQVNIDTLYWEDKAGSSSGTAVNAAGVDKALRVNANGVVIKANSGGTTPGNTLKLNTGSNGTTAGLSLELQSNPSLMTVNSLQLCDTATTAVCDSSLGKLAIESTTANISSLTTTDGLFSETAQATLNLGLANKNLYISHDSTSGSNLNNQLILKNLNFNFAAKGILFVTDSGGLTLQTNTGTAVAPITGQAPNLTYGYVDLNRVTALAGVSGGTYNGTTSGINIELLTKKDADMSLANPYSLTGSNGLIRVGANGRIVNASLQVRGVSATAVDDTGNILGKATTAINPTPSGNDATVMGSTGIAARLRAEFTKSGDGMLDGDNSKASTLEIGGAGNTTYGFEFGELSPLLVTSTNRAYFDSGNVYINLADTKQLLMPQNAALNAAKFGNGGFITTASDYKQTIHTGTGNTNPYAMVLAIRGMDFQAVSKRGRFTATDTANSTFGNDLPITATAGSGNKWGLGLPFYNVNANMAVYGSTAAAGTPVFALDSNGKAVRSLTSAATQRLGLSLALSAQGLSADGSKTTSIMVVDAVKNQYIGLRNIDMLLKGTGSMGFEQGNINLSFPDLLLVMAGQVAAGYLPGATTSSGSVVSADNFATNTDVLFGLKLRLQGKMDFSLIPNNTIGADGTTKLSIVGDFDMNQPNNTIQISEPTDGSVWGLDNITGILRFNNSITIGKDTAGAGKVGFNAEFTVNPDKSSQGVFRVKDINLYPGENNAGVISTGAPQRLGEMAITGGRISSRLGIVPRN